MKVFLALLLLMLSFSPTYAVDEESLDTALEGTILPFFTRELQSGVFEGKDGVMISFVKLEVPEEKGALVITQGRTESYIKYAELIHDLRHSGFSIYLMDHRGQGFSSRMLSDSQKGHVANFEDYVEDLKTFVDTVVNAGDHNRRFIYGHSMGGTIATLYAAKHHEEFDGMVLCAPMLQIDTSPLPEAAASLLANGLTALGMGDAYVLGGKAYDPEEEFNGNHRTHSESRHSMQKKLVSLYPQTALGSPTNRWLREALKGARLAKGSADKIQTPVLLLQAEMDSVIKPTRQNEFCQTVRDCTRIVMAGSCH
jgi:lysophospholipase